MSFPSELSPLEVIFDTYGFHSLAVSIIRHLDYFSLIGLKQASKVFYQFLTENGGIESTKFNNKLSNDWQKHFANEPKPTMKSEFKQTSSVSHIHITDNHNLAVAYKSNVALLNLRTGAVTATLNHKFENSNDMNNNNRLRFPCRVLCTASIGPALFSGLSDGHLCVWDLENLLCKTRRQLFGEIRDLKCVANFLVSGHSGNNETAGVVVVRRFFDFDNMPVVWSLHENLYPIFQVDATNVEECIIVAFVEQMIIRGGVPLGHVHLAYLEVDQEDEGRRCKVLKSMSLASYIRTDQLDSQCRIWDENRLIVTKEFGHALIFDINQQGVQMQRAIQLAPGNRLVTQLRSRSNRVICVDNNNSLLLVDLEDRKMKKDGEHNGVSETHERGELLWENCYSDALAVDISERHFICVTDDQVVVHDVWSKRETA